jgi:hypothetical protein
VPQGSQQTAPQTQAGAQPPRPAGRQAGLDRGLDRSDDAARLARLLRGDPDMTDPDAEIGGREGRGEGDGQSEDDSEQDGRQGSPGDAILFGLTGAPPPSASEAPAPDGPITATGRAAELSELTDKIAERVLVGQRADGETELRVTLNSDVFGQTDVSIARHQDAIELRIDTLSGHMQDLLRDNGAEFTKNLANRLGQQVVVEINAAGASDQTFSQGGGDNRRSRGFEQILRYSAENDR